MIEAFLIVLFGCLAVGVGLMALIFVVAPIFKGIGWGIASVFKGIGWLFAHVFGFIFGMIGDTIRFVGSVLAVTILSLITGLNVIIGRWSAAGHFASSVKRECVVGSGCLYRVLLRRPLKLVLMHGLLEGLEDRVPEAMHAAPTADTPGRRTGQFEGYTIVGSLRGGGSGARLYVAQPDDRTRRRLHGSPNRVVIKTFTITDGSSLPQIIRESRALDSARQLGHVLDHGMDDSRFFYVMPYHPGDNLGIVTRQLHGESDGNGLDRTRLDEAIGYATDLTSTLAAYHAGGLWHKDIKPENIIVHDGCAHVVDLGLVTPLRSAMTLTTHGTEYFRDPEMVRQALRGVKVHQIDGGKFDIYAAGAVLYFLLENTFPPHGGLSRFSKKSPDALRWIVRRAMAEYNKRYETADAMLADLQFVAASADPFAVKAAELPSMSGEAAAVDSVNEQQGETIAAAATPRPRVVRPHRAPAPQRPNIRLTNWWTGRFEIDRTGSPIPIGQRARRSAREQLKSARARTSAMRRKARARRNNAVDTRQPSRSLIGVSLALLALLFAGTAGILMSFSKRADGELQTAGTTSATTEQPAKVLVMSDSPDDNVSSSELSEAIQFTLDQIGQAVILRNHTLATQARQLWREAEAGYREAEFKLDELLARNDLAAVVQRKAGHWRMHTPRADSTHDLSRAADSPLPGLRLLVVNDHPASSHPDILNRVKETLEKYRAKNYHVVENDARTVARLSGLIDAWRLDPDGPADEQLEDVFESSGYFGVIWITAPSGNEQASKRYDVTMIYSTRDGALSRIHESQPEAPVPPADPPASQGAGPEVYADAA